MPFPLFPILCFSCAMESMLLLAAILFSSLSSTGFSRILGQSGVDISCMAKLIPCQPFLQVSSSSPPPPSCCTPLKDMIENDKKCLCGVFNNVDILKSFNTTQEEALKVPKACGVGVDISLCNGKNETSAPSPTSSSTVPTPSNGTTAPPPSEGSASSTNGTNTEENFADGLSPFGRSGAIVVPLIAMVTLFT